MITINLPASLKYENDCFDFAYPISYPTIKKGSHKVNGILTFALILGMANASSSSSELCSDP